MFSLMSPAEHFEENNFNKKERKFFFFHTLSQTRSENGKIFAAFYKLDITWLEEFFRKVFLSFE